MASSANSTSVSRREALFGALVASAAAIPVVKAMGRDPFDARAYLTAMGGLGSKFYSFFERDTGKTWFCEDTSEGRELTDAEEDYQLRLCRWYRESPANKFRVIEELEARGLHYVV
jgi:hypothetical protein